MKWFKRIFRNIKKYPAWFYVVPGLLIRAYNGMLKRAVEDPHSAQDLAKLPYVVVVWHNRLLFMASIFSKPFRVRSRAVISASRDGQYLSDLLVRLGVESIRGSSSKHGFRVVTQAKHALDEGYNVVFTPDGPRGPRYHMSQGPIHLASVTGIPVLPIAINASSYWELRSWDRFQIPKPWAKLTLVIGEPIRIPADLDDEELERQRKIVEERLLAITRDRGL